MSYYLLNNTLELCTLEELGGGKVPYAAVLTEAEFEAMIG